jgi:hypothetical protein
MAKKQDFMSKTIKQAQHGKSCPVCGEIYSYTRSIVLSETEEKDSYRFSEQNIGICKCNQKEFYG